MLYLIAITAGVLFYCLFAAAFSNSPKERVRTRLKRLTGRVELEYVHEAVLSEKKQQRKRGKQNSRIISRRLEDYLAASGVNFSAKECLILWGGLTIGPAVFGGLLNLKLLPILALTVIGFAILPLLVKKSRNSRQQLFNKQLGEVLTIMSNCMRSGYSFQQSMASIVKEMQPPISEEFGRVVRELNYGTPLEQALNNLVARNDNKDLDLLVSAVLTSAQVGANLSEILDTIAETVTDRITIREEVRVASSQGRLSGFIIGLLPVVVILFLMLVSPDYFGGFMDHPIGKIMIGISAVMEVLGFLIINKIVNIKY